MSALDVGIIFGGTGEEHPVSVKSAREVARHLDTTRYRPHWIGITTEGAWRLCDTPEGDWANTRSRPVVISPDRNVHGLMVLDDGRYELIRLDVVFPVLHGSFGEDGTIQGLLELSGIPYVGCDVQASAVCMDKALTYTVARSAGIETPPYWVVDADQQPDAQRLRYPVFVKPARSGSSFGVTMVTGEDELSEAVAEARRYDTKVVIEQAVAGAEVGCAVLGQGHDLLTGEVDRVALTHGFFRIHQEDAPETGSENASFIVPADIPEASRRLVHESAKAIYRIMGCTGLARVDLFLTEDGRVVLNEVNTLPGLTSYSRYPRMMAASGISMADLLDRLLSMPRQEAKR
ncbi:D-alanine--(R)-lactate ligase [Enemella sp. A6]|uniref:D-alanine--(R)-lactate ligase n=1 Tax=Enemella sp. A6 TaxID=3440152 RepID=UPI003EBCD409